jgi:hypothetical protein
MPSKLINTKAAGVNSKDNKSVGLDSNFVEKATTSTGSRSN